MNRNISNQHYYQAALWLAAGVLLFILYLTVNPAQASETTGNTLPYEDWLRTLQQSLTGPVAFSVALIGIVCCGATLIFAGGEIGRFMRSLIYIIMVMTMLIGANSLMTRFFNGASIGEMTAADEAAAAEPAAEEAALPAASVLAQKTALGDDLQELKKQADSFGSYRRQAHSAAIEAQREIRDTKRAAEDISSLFENMSAEFSADGEDASAVPVLQLMDFVPPRETAQLPLRLLQQELLGLERRVLPA